METRTLNVTQVEIDAVFASIAPVREAFIGFLLTLGINDAEKEGWKLVFTELLNNAVEHGCCGRAQARIRVEWYQTHNRVNLAVQHPGTGPAEELLCDPQLPEDTLAEGGRGLYIIRSFVDDWNIYRSRDNVRLTVFKTYPHLNYTLSLNAEADEVLDELSDCYENLTLFHRLADALKQGLPFAEFFEQTVQLFVEAGGYDFAHVEIADDCVEAELETLSQSTFFQQLHWASKPLLEQLADAPQLSWEAGTAVAALDPRTGLPTTGCAVPLMERQRRVGVLAVANGASGKGVLARDIRNLQSLAEIIGVGLTRSIMDRETTAHRIVEHEFDLAKRLQRQLMGGAAPVHDIGGYACFIESIPALDLAGDHAELKQSDHGLLHFAIIDVMGKGVPAAILAGIFRSHFLAWCDEALSAGQFLEKVNNALESQLGGQVLFITAFVGTINPLTGQCGYAGAGHPPALLLRSSGGVMELPSCGPPLGVMAGHAFEDRTVAIQHGDILMLITDGLYEWHYIDGRMFGWDAMRRWVEDQRSTSASGILHSLLEMIRQQGGSSHADDQTILMIQRKHD